MLASCACPKSMGDNWTCSNPWNSFLMRGDTLMEKFSGCLLSRSIYGGCSLGWRSWVYRRKCCWRDSRSHACNLAWSHCQGTFLCRWDALDEIMQFWACIQVYFVFYFYCRVLVAFWGQQNFPFIFRVHFILDAVACCWVLFFVSLSHFKVT